MDLQQIRLFTYLCLILAFGLAVCRIAFITTNKTYTALANNSKKVVDFGFLRGTIFDCNKVRLTNCQDEYFVAVAPNSNNLNLVNNYLDETDRNTLLSGFPIKIKVDKNFNAKGLVKLKIPKRYENTASHIIGYCNSEGDGICGIELGFNRYLKGQKVTVEFNTDVNGKVVSTTNSDQNANSNCIFGSACRHCVQLDKYSPSADNGKADRNYLYSGFGGICDNGVYFD